MTTETVQAKSHTPVLRWSEAVGKAGGHRRRPSGSGSSSPASAAAPPLPNLTSLNEALQEDLLLPTALPQARLPSSFYGSRTLSRPPPFLDNLTRSTLPTASLSPGLPDPNNPNTAHSFSLNDDSPFPTPSILSSSLFGHQNSLDALRMVRDRGIHTFAPTIMTDSTKPDHWSWRFQVENKKGVDMLLEEDDRADSVTDEQENIRRKCECIRFDIEPFSRTKLVRPFPKKSNSVLSRFNGLRYCFHRAIHCSFASYALARYQRSPRSKRDRGSHYKSACN